MGLGPAVAFMMLIVFIVVSCFSVFFIRSVRRSILCMLMLVFYLSSGIAIVNSELREHLYRYILVSPIWLPVFHSIYGVICIGIIFVSHKRVRNV